MNVGWVELPAVAVHTVVDGHETLPTDSTSAGSCCAGVHDAPPLLVVITSPVVVFTMRPTATHAFGVEQLTDSKSSDVGTGCDNQVVPSVVATICPGPTATQLVVPAQEMEMSSGTPPGNVAGDHVAPPSVVANRTGIVWLKLAEPTA
jgi:hypothetical protein